MKNAIVVGAGIAGLASSIRLALKGYCVQVYENNSYPGGKLSAFNLKGYRFDAGPSLFTMPHFVSELFELAGETTEEHFEYSKKAIACNYFWQDGSTFTAYADREKFLNEAEAVFNEPKKNIDLQIKNIIKDFKKKF